jgi:branched-chain amino acid transport system permease protein
MSEFLIVQVLNSLAYSMLLFVLALGLSLTFGLLRFVNLAHGSFFLFGGYIGSAVVLAGGGFLLAVLTSTLAAGVLGLLVEFFIVRHFYRRSDLDQVILSFGCALIIGDVVTMWGGKNVKSIALPEWLAGSLTVFGAPFPFFRLLIIAIGLALFVVSWLVIERTRVGSLLRASVDDRTMVGGLGFDVRFLYGGVFAFGALLAGAAGVIGAPVTGLYPGLDLEILITTLVVVVVGGLGSATGAFWSSLLIGFVETFGRIALPQSASFLVLVLMALVLVWRSIGKFEEEIV